MPSDKGAETTWTGTCRQCGRALWRNFFEGKFHYYVKDGAGYHNWWDCNSVTGLHEPKDGTL